MPASMKVEPRAAQTKRIAPPVARIEPANDFFTELGKARKDLTPAKAKPAERAAAADAAPKPRPAPREEAAGTRRTHKAQDDGETIRQRASEPKPASDDVTAVEAVETVTSESEPEEVEESEPGEPGDQSSMAGQLAVASASAGGPADEDVARGEGEADPEASLEHAAIEAIAPDASEGEHDANGEDGTPAGKMILPDGMESEKGGEAALDLNGRLASHPLQGDAAESADGDVNAAESGGFQLSSLPAALDDATAAAATGALHGMEAAQADAALAADSDAVAGMIHHSSHPTRTAASDVKVAPVIQQHLPPELQFAQANHEKIVTGMHGQLLPNGGSMQIRLDPPHLGPLQVSVHMRDGVMTAAFETQSDEATRLLSHSLSTLKTSLEAQGITVEKLQVQQAPKSQESNAHSDDPRNSQNGSGARDGLTEQQQQKQRQELLKRMWQRLSGDPLDLVA